MTTNSNDPSIPGTEPVPAPASSPKKPATTTIMAPSATAPKKPEPKSKLPEKRTVISGAKLSPDLSASSAVAQRSFWYWIGVTSDCPTEFLDFAGIHFPKTTELVSRGAGGETIRVPAVGTLMRLTEAQIRKIAARMAQSVIRFRSEPEQRDEPGTGENKGAPHYRAGRRGYPIRIPSAAEVEAVEKAGLPSTRYDPAPFDEPASRYVYCLLCENQEHPMRTHSYQSLEVSGLEWPGDL